MRTRYGAAAENETSIGYDREKGNISFTPNVLTPFYYLVQVGLGRFA
jgi:hypothetical protein